MKKYFALSFLVLIGNLSLDAQGNPFKFNPSLTCVDAPIICPLDGYSSSTGGANNMDMPSTFCGSIQNNQWLAFIAATTDLTIEIIVGGCDGVTDPPGVQAQVYSECDAPWESASNCLYEISPNSTGQLIMVNLTIGNTYYLMLDGFSGANCDYTLSVTSGSTQSSGANLLADAGDDIPINCLTQVAILDGSNSVYGASDSIFWMNENEEFLSDSIIYIATEPGKYYFIIQEEDGGCMTIDEVEVQGFSQILISPFLNSPIDLFPDTIGGSLFLEATNFNNDNTHYAFLWTTINGSIVAHADSIYPLISSSGLYLLEVTDTLTGCSKTGNVVVNFIDPVGVFSPLKNTLQVEITPTVTDDEIRVHYVMKNSNSVSLQIYNHGGILLQEFYFGKKEVGEHVENLSLKDFTAGVYIVFVKTEEGSAVQKVVKM